MRPAFFIAPAAYKAAGLSEGNSPDCTGNNGIDKSSPKRLKIVRKTRRKGEVTF